MSRLLQHLYLLASMVVLTSHVEGAAKFRITNTRGAETSMLTVVEHSPRKTLIGIISSREYGEMKCTTRSEDFKVSRLDQRSMGVYSRGVYDSETRDQYSFTVSCQLGNYITETIPLYVKVQDINDNAPIFDRKLYQASVYENVRVGTYLMKVKATDKDTGLNGELTYTLEKQKDSVLSIDANTGIIRTKKRLDYERVKLIRLKVKVSDKGRFPIYTTSQVDIKVLDVNDNIPRFSQSSYTVMITGNPKRGSKVIQIKATDADTGNNGNVKYRIVRNFDGLFSIDSTSGVITITRTVDERIFRDNNQVSVRVIAKDQGNRPLSASVQVHILTYNKTLNDANDNNAIPFGKIEQRNTVGTKERSVVPHFKQNIYKVAIMENVAIGTYVVHVSAVDGHTGETGSITYSLSGEMASLFKIESESGKLFTKKFIDRESRGSQIHMTVQARDYGRTPGSSSVPIIVTVVDVNDNTPHFSQYSYSASVENTSPIGDGFMRVSATDPDAGLNGHVSYSLDNVGKNWFAINATTGVISVKYSLQYRHITQIDFSVFASDSGIPIRRAARRVRVKVIPMSTENSATSTTSGNPVNHAPIFTSASYHFRMLEFAPNMGPVVGQVKAIDPDGDSVVYSIHGSSMVLTWFYIDTKSGWIQVWGAGSYTHLLPDIHFTVQATDSRTPSAVASTKVTIKIIRNKQYN